MKVRIGRGEAGRRMKEKRKERVNRMPQNRFESLAAWSDSLFGAGRP